MHPASDIRGIKSKKLSKKRIILGITGSISAVESIKLSRELIRHDAEVIPVMTEAATKIIHPYSLEFATSNRPITTLTGQTEHVKYCGLTKDPVDLLLICPCTANTISKIAHGIDDTAVTTFATTAIGSKIPIIIVPAMHLSMYNHKIIQENISKCQKIGITFIQPNIIGTKAKLQSYEEIVEHVLRKIGKNDLSKKKILVIGGATSEEIDDARIITNKSSGKTAIAIVKNAFERGAEIELWYGNVVEKIPTYIKSTKFESVNDLIKLVKKNTLSYDAIIVCAAISDYYPKKIDGKISSTKKQLNIKLTTTPKVIDLITSKAKNSKIIGFKVEKNIKQSITEAKKLLDKNDLEAVIANDISAFGNKENEIHIIRKNDKNIAKKGEKTVLAEYILDLIK